MTDPWPEPDEVAAHYARRLRLETDCADVGARLASGDADFVLLDVRSADAFAAGHVPGAQHLHHSELTAERLADFPSGTRFVVYCWGPHCNGATKGAARLGSLGFAAKEMLGGVWGWKQEGFDLEQGG